MNGQPRPADMPQHYEMVHIPVQDRGGPQAAEVRDLQPQWPTRKTELGGGVHHHSQGRALQRNRIFATQGVEVAVSSVIGRDHRQAGEPTFGGGRLMDFRQMAASAE